MNTFDALQEEYFETWLEQHPQQASVLGYTTHDTEMPSGTLKSCKKEIEKNKYFLKQFQNLNESSLDFDQRISRKLAIHKLQIFLFFDETLEYYLKNPDVTGEISAALDSLFMRRSTDRFHSLLVRLEKTPEYIADFQTRVVKPVKLWTEMALEAVRGLCQFLPALGEAAQREIPLPDAEEIEDKAKRVEERLKDYSTFLQKMLPHADELWGMDRESFDTLLTLRELPYSGDEILNLGRKWLKEEQERLRTLAESCASGKSVKEVTTLVKSNHPQTVEKILHLCRTYLKEARQFVIENNIATLPEGEKICVDTTPEYLWHWLPMGAYFPPPVTGPDRIGYYRVTPPGDPNVFKEHNGPSVINAAVHEGYPGHHLQLCCSNMHPHKLRWAVIPTETDAKCVAEGAEMIEGWALYCEELMMEKGFCTTREYQFMQSRFVVWRAVRIIVDVQLSRREITFEEAVQLMENMGMERAAAVGEVRWYTLRPSYPLSYLLGKHMLKNLKEKVKKMMGPAYTDIFFHNTLLYEGTMPLTFLEEVFAHKAFFSS